MNTVLTKYFGEIPRTEVNVAEHIIRAHQDAKMRVMTSQINVLEALIDEEMLVDQALREAEKVVVFFASLFFPSYDALEFDVGGNDGWVLNPSESYSHWAARMRFQVNDTLLFRYEKGRESVLEVGEEDYEKCNVENPMKKMEDGYSVLELDRSGPFYFISGIQQNCENGQKIVVVVLAPKHHNAPPPPPSTGGDAPPKGCSSTASPAGVAPWASPHRPSAAPPKGPSGSAPAGSPPAFNAPAKPPAPAGTPEPPSPAYSETPLPTIPVSPAKSPPAGGGCNGSSIRSDPANVHNSPASSPPQSTSAATAAIHLSAILVPTFILTMCFAFGELIIFC
ncbi:early nodulin-like protein 2 [Ipomoea triloba]|uniref:early nodulin-like protein 2 n=1 Tax=Ipomoea triloba TaxID=35885 RepID=UPI00125D5BAB|nr:early nodulin-like protein 2 [Ipomoea triloba]